MEQAPHHLTQALQRDLSARCYGWLESLADGCVVLDPALRVCYCNPAFASVWGRTPLELFGTSLADGLPAFEASAYRRLCEQALLHGRTQEGDARIGSRCYHLRAHPVAEGVLLLLADVTARRQVEDDLVDTTLHLRLLLDQVSAIHWVVDRELLFQRSTGAGLRHLGLGEDEVVGRTLYDFFQTRDPEYLPIRMHRRALEGEHVRYNQEFGDHYYEVALQPKLDGAGRVVGVAGLASDVTDQRRTEAERSRLQEQLHQAQDLESLGVLVGGVAHDFNNLLVGMLNGADLLLRDLPEGSSLRGTAEMISRAGLRARDVAGQMLVYVGKGRAARRSFDVNNLLRETVQLLRSAFPDVVHVQVDLHEPLPAVHADAGQMQQVVLNLLVNAAEALPAMGGTVRVRTGLATSAELGAGESALVAPRGYLFIEVADDGQGMTPEVEARIFEPFFTTKPTGHGLGLAAVKNILRAHSGLIRLTSAAGSGTTFRVYLPTLDPLATAAALPADAPNVTGEVLVVDDEPFVRDIVGRLLNNVGYATRTAASGADAVAQVRSHATIGLVVLDLKMPNMDGWETLDRLREIRPQLQAILTSGYVGGEVGACNDPRLVGFLPKPYVFDDLLALVRQGLEHASQFANT